MPFLHLFFHSDHTSVMMAPLWQTLPDSSELRNTVWMFRRKYTMACVGCNFWIAPNISGQRTWALLTFRELMGSFMDPDGRLSGSAQRRFICIMLYSSGH